MPMYELKCEKCGHQFTMLGSYAEKETAKCPECKSSDLRQIYFGVSTPKSKSGGSCSTGGGFRGG